MHQHLMKVILDICVTIDIVNERVIKLLSDLRVLEDLPDDYISDHCLITIPPVPVIVLKMGSYMSKSKPEKTNKNGKFIDAHHLKPYHGFVGQS